MSIPFEKEIFSNADLKIYINFHGIDPDKITSKEDIKLTIYAISSSKPKHLFSHVLSFEDVLNVYNHLNSVSVIREASSSTVGRFIEVTSDLEEIISLVKAVDSSFVKKILDKAGENEKLRLVVEALTESEIENLEASIKQTINEKALKNLEELLVLEEKGAIVEEIKKNTHLSAYSAGQPEKIFQNWIEKNIWTLGIGYIAKHPARGIGLSSESDMIMESTDGFIDLIELKRPKLELFSFDESHKSYYPSKELSKVLGQCLNYLKILDNYKLILEKEHKFKVLRPRIKIIAGRSNMFNDEQHEALRMLNSSLNHIEVMTYDYLLLCGRNIVSYYKK